MQLFHKALVVILCILSLTQATGCASDRKTFDFQDNETPLISEDEIRGSWRGIYSKGLTYTLTLEFRPSNSYGGTYFAKQDHFDGRGVSANWTGEYLVRGKRVVIPFGCFKLGLALSKNGDELRGPYETKCRGYDHTGTIVLKKVN